MSLVKQARAKAKQTSKATLKVGFSGQVRLRAGVVARFLTAVNKPKAFVEYSDESEETTRIKAIELAEKVSGDKHTDVMPCLWIEVQNDTSLTPTSRYNGSFVDLTEPNAKQPRTLKRHGEFIFSHMSEEVDANADKAMWVHIQWVRLTPDFGGDLSLLGDDANDELAMLLTWLPNKKAATTLLNGLREGDVTLDGLAADRGYDASGIRQTLREAAGKAKEKANEADDAPTLSAIGDMTKKAFGSIEAFTEVATVKFLKENYEKLGNVDALSEMSKAGTGDLALLVGDKDYFLGLMEATGLGEQEALVQVVNDTGVGNGADVAALLGITEAPF